MRIVIAAGIATAFALLLARGIIDSPGNTNRPATQALSDQDKRLQEATSAALGAHEGAIVVLDPQTGRVRAVVNQKLAFQNAFPPGSTIKPFTAFAALRNGAITKNTRLRCRGKYKREDVVDACVHPPKLPPFNAAEALSHSCNYYFATVGERIEEENFAHVLTEFGFGQPPGIEGETASAGVLARGRWQPESAVGEGAFLQVTPIQMALAYAALFNGGRLLKPTLSCAENLTPQVRTQLRIEEYERAMLLEGMRGAVTFGTAETADLDSLPVYVAGKTGTSTQLQGFRAQGWFAGVAFAPGAQPDPVNALLVVVVYLKNAHGAEAADVARPIFAEFAGARNLKNDAAYVSVHQASEKSTLRMSLDDYILQVIASEASVEDESEALKALAVVARTYALKNLGRHKQHGYDFCSTTHCQRFESIVARPALKAAVEDTAGLVLCDDRDEIIDAYYSASCGGSTANLKALWREDAPTYLRGVRDDYCNNGSHYRWTDVISAARLAAALRSDQRTDVGQTLRDLSVVRYDQTGRAELLSIQGNRKRTINGWEFKLIVGRALGWNLLKSSRFSVSRSGSQFVFRGGGFGHGLGLCQEGSHVMAQREHSFQQILAHYYPTTKVRDIPDQETRKRGDAANFATSRRHHISASNFRVIYPETVDAREAKQLVALLESNRAELLRRVSASGIQPRFPNVQIVLNETTGDFTARTGMPAWATAATRNHTVELQPLKILKQRRILETTLRHELVHVLIDAIGGGQTPRWLTEGMALYVSAEGRLIERQPQINSLSAPTVEQALASAKSAPEMRIAYAAAYRLVKNLIRSEGEDKVWQRLANRSYSVKPRRSQR